MSAAPAIKAPQNVAVLRGFNEDGNLVIAEVMSRFDFLKSSLAMFDHDYTEGRLTMLVCDEYRVKNGIRRVLIRLHDAGGAIAHEFDWQYDKSDAELGDRICQGIALVSAAGSR